MSGPAVQRQFEILLVEDNSGDVLLIKKALQVTSIASNLNVVYDGMQAIAFLHRQAGYEEAPRPDLILLDLNLPKMDGRDVLTAIKQDSKLRRIPVIVLTSSEAEQDIIRAYDLHANCYVQKPFDLKQFWTIVKSILDFWFVVAKLPPA